MVQNCLDAADILAKEGISAEVVDPRTLVPLDKETLIKSAKKTGRYLLCNEACQTGGYGGRDRRDHRRKRRVFSTWTRGQAARRAGRTHSLLPRA
jgi:pyruvate/2-oxoglutarate/acetoin dehydrogenase E1 component